MIRWLCFVAVFCMDVRVRANEPSERIWKGRERPQTLTWSGASFTLGKSSLMTVMGEQDLRLVEGRAWVGVPQDYRFSSPYGSFYCLGDRCEGLLDRNDREFRLRALSGDWAVEPRGEDSRFSVLEGQEVRLSSVRASGRAGLSFPMGLVTSELVADWASVFVGDASALRQRLGELQEHWREAMEQSAQDATTHAMRSLAEHQEQVRLAEQRRQSKAREDAALRELFRQRNP
jgi:hypothetical protein